jgi:1,4-dihydroxy-2-naphthoate octaprenyltransferase
MVNVAMWGKALKGIPRLSAEEWSALDVVSRWLIATRSAVILMTLMSSAIAGLLAYRDGQFNWTLWLLLTGGLMLAHATNNLLNDLIDHKRGVDRGNYFRAQYGPQPLEHGLLTERQLWMYILPTFVIALGIGLYLGLLRGEYVWWMLGAGVFFVIFYTYPLKYIGLGEVTVVLVWGPMMIGGGYYVITGAWDWNVVIAGLPYALGPTCVLFGKHIDKLASDSEKKIYTLPVILGERNARAAVLAMTAAQYVSLGYLILVGFFSPAMVVAFLGLTGVPRLYSFYHAPKPASKPDDYDANVWPLWFSAISFWHNRRFGGAFLLGLLLDVVWKKML